MCMYKTVDVYFKFQKLKLQAISLQLTILVIIVADNICSKHYVTVSSKEHKFHFII